MKVIEGQQPHDAESERADRQIMQKIRANPVRDPEQHSRFHQPAHGNPVPVQPDRNGNRDQGNGQRQMQQPQRLRIRRLSTAEDAAQPDVHRRQGKRKPSHGRLIDLLDHGVGLEKIHAGVDESEYAQQIRQGNLPLRSLRYQRGHGKNGEKDGSESKGSREFVAAIVFRVPGNVERQCAGITEDE